MIQKPPKAPTDSEISDTQNPPEVLTSSDEQNPPEMPFGQLPGLPSTNSAQLRPFL
jgi:hypothetical protein